MSSLRRSKGRRPASYTVVHSRFSRTRLKRPVRIRNWKAALNQFVIFYGDRVSMEA